MFSQIIPLHFVSSGFYGCHLSKGRRPPESRAGWFTWRGESRLSSSFTISVCLLVVGTSYVITLHLKRTTMSSTRWKTRSVWEQRPDRRQGFDRQLLCKSCASFSLHKMVGMPQVWFICMSWIEKQLQQHVKWPFSSLTLETDVAF